MESLTALLEQPEAVPPRVLVERLAPVEAVLASGVATSVDAQTQQRLAAALCSWLRGNTDAPDADLVCLYAVLRVLCKLLEDDPVSGAVAVQKGLLSTATTLLIAHAANARLVRSCLEAVATLSAIENSDVIISRLGTVALVVDMLRRYRDVDDAVLEDAVTALALLAKRTRHRRTLSKGGGITELVDTLKRSVDRPPLVIAVCRCFGNFAAKEEFCLTALEHGGVGALMAAFDTASRGVGPAPNDTRAAVLSAIWACSTDCGKVQQALLASGWLASLAAVLQAGEIDHAGLHEAALGIVRGLSRGPQYQADIVNLGFIQTTIQAMQTFRGRTSLLKEACGVLGNLASDPEIRAQLGESGAVEEICAVLRGCQKHDDRKVAKLALGALSNLASSDSNREAMAKTDVAQTLLEASRVFISNENVIEYAVGAISHLVVHEGCCAQLQQAGAVEALLLFVSEHKEDLQVVSKSLVALRKILRRAGHAGPGQQQAVLQQVARAGGRDGCSGAGLLADAMQEHIYDAVVVREVALILAGLARSPSASAKALMVAAVQPCMKALELHQNEAEVADALAGLLSELPLEEDDRWAKGGSAPAPARLDDLVVSSPRSGFG